MTGLKALAPKAAAPMGLQMLLLAAMSLAGEIGAARATSATVRSAGPHLRQSIELQVLVAPEPVRTAAGLQLVYELHITNFAPFEIDLTRIDVLDGGAGGRTIREFQDGELAGMIGHPGMPSDAGKNSIAPGARVVVYLGLALDTHQAPRLLRHDVEFDLVQSSGREHMIVQGPAVSVNVQQPIVLGPPLRGGHWVAIYDPSANRGHRRVIYAINGRARIPGRFAIDWIQVNEHGEYAHGDSSQVANWYGYGAEVLAVAEARVAAARDDISESSSLTTVANSLEDASGNYVALELRRDVYAFYEHLQPRSIVVKPGERVKAGQVIARLGYTGDSTGPHLHFHVADANSPLGAESVPYVIDHFDMLGEYESLEMFGRGRWVPAAQGTMGQRTKEFPTPAAVVDFGH